MRLSTVEKYHIAPADLEKVLHGFISTQVIVLKCFVRRIYLVILVKSTDIIPHSLRRDELPESATKMLSKL